MSSHNNSNSFSLQKNNYINNKLIYTTRESPKRNLILAMCFMILLGEVQKSIHQTKVQKMSCEKYLINNFPWISQVSRKYKKSRKDWHPNQSNLNSNNQIIMIRTNFKKILIQIPNPNNMLKNKMRENHKLILN